MKVPFIDLKRHEPGFVDAVTAKLSHLVSEARFIGGEEVERLEHRLRDVFGVTEIVSCANGTDALQLALRGLDVGPGDVVLVPDVTFWATFEAVVNVGAVPATVDIDPADGGMSLSALEMAIEQVRPKAVILVHLYGWGSANVTHIRELCRQKGVWLIEDGAQCAGTSYRGKPLLQDAFIATSSFYPAKVLGASGDGGAVMTNDPALAGRFRKLANHGRATHYSYDAVGWNSRMDTLHAAYLNLSLDYLAPRLASRREAAAYYRSVLPTLGVDVLAVPDGYEENGYCNVCLFADPQEKTRIESVLKEQGIGFANTYPGTISAQDGAKPYLKAHIGGAAGKGLCASVVNLPLFPYITQAELDRVIAVLGQALETRQ